MQRVPPLFPAAPFSSPSALLLLSCPSLFPAAPACTHLAPHLLAALSTFSAVSTAPPSLP
eukprot:358412-Chlamydomonas_euryale.AAC.8